MLFSVMVIQLLLTQSYCMSGTMFSNYLIGYNSNNHEVNKWPAEGNPDSETDKNSEGPGKGQREQGWNKSS